MLHIARSKNEEIYFTFTDSNGETIKITQKITRIDERGSVRIGIDAPKSVRIERSR